MTDLPTNPEAWIMCHEDDRRTKDYADRQEPCPVCQSRGYYCSRAPQEMKRDAGPGVTVIHAGRHKDYDLEEAEA